MRQENQRRVALIWPFQSTKNQRSVERSINSGHSTNDFRAGNRGFYESAIVPQTLNPHNQTAGSIPLLRGYTLIL